MRSERRPGPSTRVRVHEWRGDTLTRHEDRLATEEPLEIRLASPGVPARRFVVTMRTPGADFALATGLTYAEGVFADPEALRTVAYCTDETLAPHQAYNVVTVELDRPPLQWNQRGADMSAACGVCGKDSLDAVARIGASRQQVTPVAPVAVVRGLPDRLREQQRVFDSTGGLHAAGLFTADGTPVLVREDIGRHNAVDKVIGQLLLDHAVPSGGLAGTVLCSSGRLGFEIVQKAAVAGVPVVVAVGAPSSLAVSLADDYGICVAGFARGDRMVVYTHATRLG
jgi:FdhD protein